MKKILFIVGTRPEAIKLAPLIHSFRQEQEQYAVAVCATGQHRELLHQALDFFQIQPDYDLQIMTPQQSLSQLSAELMRRLEPVLEAVRPHWVFVQGDTTSAFCGALSAFYAGIPVVHVEAGLRSGDLQSPFPEELNRRLIARIAHYHFSPTPAARDHLIAEGIAPGRIAVCGNTGIDALLYGLELVRKKPSQNVQNLKAKVAIPGGRLVTVTLHRRENFVHLAQICRALLQLTQRPNLQVVFAVHPNPEVRQTVEALLAGHPNISLLPPLAYDEFLCLMEQSALIITDSGGIQEEAPTLGKPVVVVRTCTERSELFDLPNAFLSDPEQDDLEAIAWEALNAPLRISTENPFGDGRTCERILAFMKTVSHTSF